MRLRVGFVAVGISVLGLGIGVGCSRGPGADARGLAPAGGTPILPPMGHLGTPAGDGSSIRLSNGAVVPVLHQGERSYFEVEATYTENDFAAIARVTDAAARDRAATETRDAFAAAGALVRATNAEVGYFAVLLPLPAADSTGTVDLFARVKNRAFPHRLLLNPVVPDLRGLDGARAFTPRALGLDTAPDPADYSGLEALREAEFQALVRDSLGNADDIDGSGVRVGVTDTGFTLNHPAFLAADGASSRVEYLKDSSHEGAAYFLPSGPGLLAVPGAAEDEVAVSTEILVTPRLPQRPLVDVRRVITDLKLKVGPELKALLLARGAEFRLGAFFEDAIQGAGSRNDVNGNGKYADTLWVLLLPGATPADDVAYVDFSGAGDFRGKAPLRDWNRTRDSVRVFAERVGVAFGEGHLGAKQDPEIQIPARVVDLVGFDPGNHGTHVSGIAVGRREFAAGGRGVAPGASLLMNRVCAVNGGCNATAGLVDLATAGGAEVINMSLGGLSPFNDGYGVQETLINRLTATRNVVFMISAGNSGPGRQTVASPSTARLSLSIGATASTKLLGAQYQWPGTGDPSLGDEFMLFFSSRGPTAAGGFKPSLAAPGTELSSIQLNSAAGARAGLDVYWGTSMAAPTATGAFALLKDAIRRFNAANPASPLATDALALRRALLESARPFERRLWTDQGAGMLNLAQAWRTLVAQRDQAPPPAIHRADGAALELDYEVLAAHTGTNGLAYDGSLPLVNSQPRFAAGVDIDFFGTETLIPVSIARRLPEGLLASPEGGDLFARLATTADEFELRAEFQGGGADWLTLVSRDQLPCASAPATDRLRVIGQGALTSVGEDGKGRLTPLAASNLSLCLDREKIALLAPGDHGVLIRAYRRAGAQIAPVASFEVPVSLVVPARRLEDSTGHLADGEVAAFQISRHYVQVPAGTSAVTITLEVPAPKVDARGRLAAGEICSGVELMALAGQNDVTAVPVRKNARAANCDPQGRPLTDPAARRIRVVRTDPRPGLWDVHVFGQYKFARSSYSLRVDYVAARASIAKIEGTAPAALSGTFRWSVAEASQPIEPSATKSAYLLEGLRATSQAQVANEAKVFVESPLGRLRAYPPGVTSVSISTGQSPGNDLDLLVYECPPIATAPDDPACHPVAESGGPTDEELARFAPRQNRFYSALVHGFKIGDAGHFVTEETIFLKPEPGTLEFTPAGPGFFDVAYSFGADPVAGSALLKHPLFGRYRAVGKLVIANAEGAVLTSLPVSIGP